MTQPATIADFKTQFDRDFIFGSGIETIRDTDITRALNQADIVFNPNLWSSTNEAKIAYLFAAAHMLVLNIQNAGGLSPVGAAADGVNSYGGGIIQSKSVGQVSVNYQLPTSLTDNPILNQFMRTGYGQQYLQLVTPYLVGGGFVVNGWNDVDE